jgi:hypothetical protein
MWVFLEDITECPPETPYSDISLRLKEIRVRKRWPDFQYQHRHSLPTCRIYSWLCADIQTYPYYEYVYWENFDKYGKRGSMRHFWATRWAGLVALIGIKLATVWVSVCGIVSLVLVLKAILRRAESVVELYRLRIQEVDEWNADEEVDEHVINGPYNNKPATENKKGQ